MRQGSSWTIVVPVKGTEASKSRLGGAAEDRLALAEAMALDTVEVALRVAPVLVIGGPALSAAFASLGASVMTEQPGDGLNGAIARALATLDGPTAVLLADLPALRPDELAAALQKNVMVPDAEGTGTSLITGSVPAFGAGSRDAHRALGYRELDLPVTSGLRLDVDSPEALAAIPRARLGPRTAALRAGLGAEF
ncbi:MAG: 2-phospho-L-lactate guanylyltransferase [Salinibacterium sp.]|nr:2-phospho-L-lactate guanylyltransferase [Salinibacterium sp.]